MMKKRAVFFSTDALIALSVIFIGILITYPLQTTDHGESYVQRDLIRALSSLKIGEMNNSQVKGYLSGGLVSNPNKTVLEQIGEFYVLNKSIAVDLANIIFDEINTSDDIGIWFGSELIASRNSSPLYDARNILTDRQIISGIQSGSSVTAFSARAFLTSSLQNKYFYFGGYVGEGNLSARIEYYGNISSALIEIATAKDFEVYINDVYSGNFSGSTSLFTPQTYSLPTTNFNNGVNIVEFRGDNLNIAGGFLKISYLRATNDPSSGKYYFPGIDGIINLYDGMYVPGNLTGMDIFLHYNNNLTTFLNIGNVTVYNGSTSGEDNVSISDAYLSSVLDYAKLSQVTIPIRFGIENATYFSNISKPVDVFSVTDLSGSMNWQCSNTNWWCRFSQSNCEGAFCGGTWTPTPPIDVAKDANKAFIDAILNGSKNRVGLVGYRSSFNPNDFHELSKNDVSLKSEVDSWSASGATCICCGINEAVDQLVASMSSQGGVYGNLQTYYNLNSDALDKSGRGNNASVFGSPTYVGGVEGNSLDLDGASDYLTAGNISNVSSSGTIAFWFNPNRKFDNKINNPWGLWSKFESNSNNFFIALKGKNLNVGSGSDGSIQVKMENSGNVDYLDTNKKKWDQGTWYHFALNWNGSVIKIYVDGVFESSVSSSLGLSFSGIHNFGRTEFDSGDYSGGPEHLDGRIDEIRVYDYALSDSEISSLADSNPSCGNLDIEVGEVCDGASSCSLSGLPGAMSCSSSCDSFIGTCDTSIVCGNGIVQASEQCDDGNTVDWDGCSSSCEIEERLRSLVVMSDGWANRECARQNTGDARNDAIQAACDAYTDHEIKVYSVGFGAGADETTLQSIASCGNGTYYYGSVSNLVDIYKNIAGEIIEGAFFEQTLVLLGNFSSRLYPDSYINLQYNESTLPFGIIVTAEEQFDDAYSGRFNIPENSTVVETVVVSYSGPRWTSEVLINATPIYNLSEYNLEYIQLGDPYSINIPNSYISGNNLINLTTGLSPSNLTEGSESNKIIYTIVRGNIAAYSALSNSADGCLWTIEFENLNLTGVAVPSNYSGTENCFYTSGGQNISNSNDAMQIAVKKLLELIDFDLDGIVDVKFSEQDLQISSSAISGIPYSWSTEMQVRTWT